MLNLIRDIRFGTRLLFKDRAYTITTILTLAVCIGANTAVFAIVYSVILRPLPVPEADRLLLMSNQYPNAGVGQSNNSGVPDYYDRLRDVTAFEGQALCQYSGNTVEVNGTPERMRGMVATPSLFRLLRVKPIAGRIFSEDEGEVGNEKKVILSYGLWQQLFAGDSRVIGQTLRINGEPYTMVGIMPPGFLFLSAEVRLWTPAAFSAQQKSDDSRHSNNWFNIGRLKPGATLEQAQAQVNALNAANLERFPEFKQILINAGFHTTVEPLQEMLVRDIRRTLYLLWGGAAFVLLIGALNITNLALARARLRFKELATRLALGASRGGIARQLIAENVMLAMTGGLVGLVMAAVAMRALVAIGLEEVPRAPEIHIGMVVIVATLAVSVAIGIFIGAAPLAGLFRIGLNTMLREESRSGTSSRASRLFRRGMVVAQVAFAFILLMGAGLLFAGFRHLLAVNPGFEPAGVMTWAMNTTYDNPQNVIAFMDRTLAAIRAIPGVTAAGATNSMPLSGNYNDSVIIAEGHVMQPGESLISPHQLRVTPGFLEAMGIRVVKGRSFDNSDVESSQPVALIDETLAQKFWPNQDPIGRRMFLPDNAKDLLKTDEHTKWIYVVGVVRDIRLEDLGRRENTAGMYYFPWDQSPSRNPVFAVKTSGDPAGVLRAIRAEVAKIDPTLPLFDVRSMEDRVATSLLSRRAAMILAITFGGVALLLSAVGIYGVLAYLVSQRTREIGIRIALGSTTRNIFSLVLREGLTLVITGVIAGALGCAALRQVIVNEIYGVRSMDPIVILGVAVLLGLIAVIACVLPARRATLVDPVAALM